MKKIYLDNDSNNILCNWKDEICENFDQRVIMYGNPKFNEHLEASWYKRMMSIMCDIDASYDKDSIIKYHNITYAEYKSLKDLYDNCRMVEDIMLECLQVLYPKMQFTYSCIRGSIQGEWQNVIYEGELDEHEMKDFYFQYLTEVFADIDGENQVMYISNSKLYELERNNSLNDYLKEVFGLPRDTSIQVFKSDGYIRTKKWKEVA